MTTTCMSFPFNFIILTGALTGSWLTNLFSGPFSFSSLQYRNWANKILLIFSAFFAVRSGQASYRLVPCVGKLLLSWIKGTESCFCVFFLGIHVLSGTRNWQVACYREQNGKVKGDLMVTEWTLMPKSLLHLMSLGCKYTKLLICWNHCWSNML